MAAKFFGMEWLGIVLYFFVCFSFFFSFFTVMPSEHDWDLLLIQYIHSTEKEWVLVPHTLAGKSCILSMKLSFSFHLHAYFSKVGGLFCDLFEVGV